MKAAPLSLLVSARDSIVLLRPWLCASLLFAAIVSPALVGAQFQEPTQEELKMTADPKAPGAAAVYLYREETADDSQQMYSYYERIKVLTEKGREQATIRVPYERGEFKVTDIQGRTIHSDGTVIPLVEKPADLVGVKTKGLQINAIVFTLPSVEVGSILEYRLKLRFEGYTPLPSWEIQQPLFVHKAHYSYHSSNENYFYNLLYAYKIDSDAKVIGKHGDNTLDVTDVPPLPDEDWMLPLNISKWHVKFYITHFTTSDTFWDDTRKTWASWIENFVKPTGVLKKAVADIVAPSDTDEQKAIKIYNAVQKLDNTDFSRKKSEAERKKERLKDIHTAEDVWKQQSGSADDIALLYAAMARAAGLKVWPVYVVNRNRAIFDTSYLSNSQFDNDIVMIELGGKNTYLDPGQKMCPFGSMHWKHTLASGIRQAEKGAVFDSTPGIPYKSDMTNRIADLTIGTDGDVKGTVRYVITGAEALYWRQLALENDVEEVQKQFIESVRESIPEGVQADFDHFVALDDYNSNLIGFVKISGNIGAATGKHFFLPGLFFESRARHPFVAQEKRITPIDLHYAKMELDDVVYHLPSGYTVESSPKTSNVTWPNHAVLKINSATTNGSVEVVRSFACGFTLLEAKDYNDLHDFYQKVAAADQQQLVLTRAPESKGN
jgi:hypothetical protein